MENPNASADVVCRYDCRPKKGITFTRRGEQAHCSKIHQDEWPKRSAPARQALQAKALTGAPRPGPQAPRGAGPPAPPREKKRKAADTGRPKPAHRGPGQELQRSIEALKKHNDELRRELDESMKREERTQAAWLVRLQDADDLADQKLAAAMSAFTSSAIARDTAHRLSMGDLEGRMQTITSVQKTSEDELKAANARIKALTVSKAALEVDVTCILCADERRCVQLLPCNHIPFCRTCYIQYCAAKQLDAFGGLVCPVCNGVCRGCVKVFL